MENQQLAPQNGQAPTFDPLQDCIVNLIAAMKADFGNKFKTQFEDAETLRQYKRRLYSVLRHDAITSIMSGYEDFIETSPVWPPTVPDLHKFVLSAGRKTARDAENKIEASRLSALPAPKITEGDPLALFAKAKAATAGNKENDHEEWIKRKEKAWENNEAVLGVYQQHIRKPTRPNGQQMCKVDGCGKAGGISQATTGGGYFYCITHYGMI